MAISKERQMAIPSRPEDIPEDGFNVHPVAWAVLSLIISFSAAAYILFV